MTAFRRRSSFSLSFHFPLVAKAERVAVLPAVNLPFPQGAVLHLPDKAPEPAPRAGRHEPQLDGIRGLAILAVLLSHAIDQMGVMPRHEAGQHAATVINKIFTPSWGGVDLFFALSGFLITGILLRTRTAPHAFRTFYARRVVRIFPIYYLVLLVTLVVAKEWPAFALRLPPTWREQWPFLLYLQNWPVFWPTWAGMTSLWGAYWSLAVEEQFYLVWPFLVRFVSPRALLWVCLLGFMGGWPERAWMIQQHGLALGLMQWPFSRLDGLFLGAAIALYTEVYGRPVPKAWAISALTVGAALLAGIAFFHTEQMDGAGLQLWERGVTAFALVAAGLIVLTQHNVAPLKRVLTVRPLLLLGRLSYGMYMYHLGIYWLFAGVWLRFFIPRLGNGFHPLVSTAFMLFGMLATVGVAWLSFRYLETPFLALKHYFPSGTAVAKPAPRPAASSGICLESRADRGTVQY